MERSGKWIHAAVIRKLRIPSLTPSQLFRVTRKLHSHADFVALDRFESQTVSAGGTLLKKSSTALVATLNLVVA